MQTTGISSLDSTIHKTNVWLKELGENLGSTDRHFAYLALRSVLNTLRDRLTVEETADLGAQLPVLVRGLYYDGWNPSGKPVKFDKDDFITCVRNEFSPDSNIDPEIIAGSVFRLLDRHISGGEISDIKAILPKDLKKFWQTYC
jgi:uncharacterized protein (DUF2267 family)